MIPEVDILLAEMSAQRNQKNIDGMARFGIVSPNALGLTTPYIKSLAKIYTGNHALALELWANGIFEVRVLAALIADPNKISKVEMTRWAEVFDNWAICDGVCMHYFRKTPHAHQMIPVWVKRKEEFVRRAGFTMIATLAVHDKQAKDSVFKQYLSVCKAYAKDERNGVKKAVNWALRQIGKRNLKLNAAAIRVARQLRNMDSSAARWIAADALRELEGDAVQRRLKNRAKNKVHVLPLPKSV